MKGCEIMGIAQAFTLNFLVLFIVGLIVCLVGYYKYVYFISLGYGFSISAVGIAMLIMFKNSLNAVTVILCALFIVYGFRLGGYLLVREIKSSAYRNTMKNEIKDGSTMKLIAKIGMWISCPFLYCLQVSPVLYRMQNTDKADACAVAGAVVMALGIILESTADLQKSKAKKANPNRFCDKGLYKLVRCPNYLGEVVFWTGVFISGLNVLSGVCQWLLAAVGYICIVYIMFGGARRLEIRQNKNYGNDSEYREYVKKTPILIPFVPLYSVEKYKWLVG